VCDEVVKGKDIVIHVAAKVGGLWFHVGRQAEFFYENALMALNMVDASHAAGVKKFVGLGSVCEYPDDAPIPFTETDLWNGYPSKITAPYGLAKRMLLVASQAYHDQYNFNAIHLLMINLYGPGDDFNPKSSHAIPALIRRVFEAKREGKYFIEVWGDGTASREFLYVQDAAEGIVLAAEKYDKPEPVNLGAGREIPIKNMAEMICKLMDFKGEIKWDISKIGGQLRRILDTSLAEKEFGFRAGTSFEEGLQKTIDWFIENQKKINT
jgi:GDP-L-fucose synthase